MAEPHPTLFDNLPETPLVTVTAPLHPPHSRVVYSDELVRQVRELRATGLGPRRIAKALGTPLKWTKDVVYGKKRTGTWTTRGRMIGPRRPPKPRPRSPHTVAEGVRLSWERRVSDPNWLPSRFAMRTKPGPNGCVDWTGAIGKAGYGQIKAFGYREGAHRVAWEMAYGPIPKDAEKRWVLHSCDRKVCVNVAHLRLGDAKENMADALARHPRFKMSRVRETRKWRSKLFVGEPEDRYSETRSIGAEGPVASFNFGA